jgi:hypothetical protein
MVDGKNERMAVQKGEYRKLFEVCANALNKGKSVRIKSMHGYRKFYIPTEAQRLTHAVLLMCDANALNTHLMMVEQEFNPLLSIERPLIRIATKSEVLKKLFGSSVVVKYPDDGLSMLLARSLVAIGRAYIVYEACDAETEADFVVDFDLPLNPQKDTRLFINQEVKQFVSGERIVFPLVVEEVKESIAVAHELAYVAMDEVGVVDSMELFENVKATGVHLLEGEPFESGHSNEKQFAQYEASMLSVLAEHHLLGSKAVGVHFDTALHFLYYNQKRVIEVVPPVVFEADKLWEQIATLREGSDRLVTRYKEKYPELYERLDALSGEYTIFDIVAITLGLADESIEGISVEALSFLGKGGLQIDTRLEDNRFDNYAFLASILSYQLAEVETGLLCYSIYESLGDYIGELVPQLLEKIGTQTVVLTGESFANQSLYSRIQRTLGRYEPFMGVQLPLGKESAVHGAIYI